MLSSFIYFFNNWLRVTIILNHFDVLTTHTSIRSLFFDTPDVTASLNWAYTAFVDFSEVQISMATGVQSSL